MCRNIKTLFNFEPPATEDEVHASALQFVRKLSGFNKPSQANAAAFELAVDEVSQAAHKLLAVSADVRAGARSRSGGREGAPAGPRAVCLKAARAHDSLFDGDFQNVDQLSVAPALKVGHVASGRFLGDAVDDFF